MPQNSYCTDLTSDHFWKVKDELSLPILQLFTTKINDWHRDVYDYTAQCSSSATTFCSACKRCAGSSWHFDIKSCSTWTVGCVIHQWLLRGSPQSCCHVNKAEIYFWSHTIQPLNPHSINWMSTSLLRWWFWRTTSSVFGPKKMQWWLWKS